MNGSQWPFCQAFAADLPSLQPIETDAQSSILKMTSSGRHFFLGTPHDFPVDFPWGSPMFHYVPLICKEVSSASAKVGLLAPGFRCDNGVVPVCISFNYDVVWFFLILILIIFYYYYCYFYYNFHICQKYPAIFNGGLFFCFFFLRFFLFYFSPVFWSKEGRREGRREGRKEGRQAGRKGAWSCLYLCLYLFVSI